MSRGFWVFIHRWAGLAMAGFLIMVGLTGSLLAFLPELDRAINPHLYAPEQSAPALAPGELAARVEASAPQVRVTGAHFRSGRAEIYVEPREGADGAGKQNPGFNLIFLNPYDGQELGRTNWGEITLGFTNFMSFIYKLHFELALGMWGVWILGITALAWTIDCFIGFYLTLPATRKTSSPTEDVERSSRRSRRSWQSRWADSWKVKWRGSAFRINFDLHRAGGLWLWAALLIFAWSSVYMSFWDTVYTWTTRAVLDYKEPWTELALKEKPAEHSALDWRSAQSVAEKLMAEQSTAHDFTVLRPVGLGRDSSRGIYAYTVRSSLDFQDKRGKTQIFFDADDGALKLVLLPTGQFAGNTVTYWLAALHMANVFGLPWRIFVCFMGLAVAGLSGTGVYIWWKKQQARKLSARARDSGASIISHKEETFGSSA